MKLFPSMRTLRNRWVHYFLSMLLATAAAAQTPSEVPHEKVVVLTFDDSKSSHHSFVRPLLKEYGFGATFFVTEGFDFPTNKRDYLTWEQIAELHHDGFEIGNHTRDHLGLSVQTLGRYRGQIEWIQQQCKTHGIPRPTSFAYPGNAIHPSGIGLLKEMGFRWARRGGSPEFPYEDGRGSAFEPGRDHSLLLPSAGDARPHWSLENFQRAVNLGKEGRIPILQFHGVPDVDHPWVSTPPEQFVAYMDYLKKEGYQVLALRDLTSRIPKETVEPEAPWAVIESRRQAQSEMPIRGKRGG